MLINVIFHKVEISEDKLWETVFSAGVYLLRCNRLVVDVFGSFLCFASLGLLSYYSFYLRDYVKPVVFM